MSGLTSALPTAVPQPGRLLVNFPPGSRARCRHCDHPLAVDDAIGWMHFSGWLCPTGLSIADPDPFSITPEPAVTPGQPNSPGGTPG